MSDASGISRTLTAERPATDAGRSREWLVFVRAMVALVAPTLILCVGLLEVGLRLAGRLPSNSTEGIYDQHGTGYRLRRNLTKLSRTPSFSHTIFTNDMGFRDRAPGHRTLGAGPIRGLGRRLDHLRKRCRVRAVLRGGL